MRQLMFSIDFNRCINCKTCEMSCNEYYHLTETHRRHVMTYEHNNEVPIHLSISCNHCANPFCVSVCPENNFHKRADGIVVHRASNCRACMRCITACPFEAPKLNPTTKRADKCNFCVERIDEGLKPVCVENCITGALGLMEMNRSDTPTYSFWMDEAPVAAYTTPSIFVIKKRPGSNYFREG